MAKGTPFPSIFSPCLLSLILCFLNNVQAARVNDMIYYTLPTTNFTACFRLLNATHQIGCSSDRGGNVGVAHLIESEDDVAWLTETGPHDPYITLITPAMFSKDVVEKLILSSKVNGMLVLDGNYSRFDHPDHFSPVSTCPNSQFDAYTESSEYSHCRNISWNQLAMDLVSQDLNMPIAVLNNNSNIDFLITECYEKWNKPINGSLRQYPLCSISMFMPMDAAKDTPTCLRRSQLVTNLNPQTYCDPVGGKNTYAFLEPVNSSRPITSDSVTVIGARMDGFSMFYEDMPSADSSVAGMVTVLAVAEALGSVKQSMKPYLQDKPILFTLFNGEAFEYSGSIRMVREMQVGNFPSYISEGDFGPAPIRLSSLKQFIEVGQVGLHTNDESELWIHSDPLSRRDAQINTDVESLVNNLHLLGSEAGMTFSEPPHVQPLPPASFHSFLRERNMSGIVVTNHRDYFTNKYYNSRLDAPDNIGIEYDEGLTPEEQYDFITPAAAALTKLATSIARLVYNETTGNASAAESVTANNKTITNLLYCFLVNSECELFNYTLEEKNAKALKASQVNPVSSYVGVERSTEWYSILARNLLQYFTGDKLEGLNKTECGKLENSLYNYLYVQGDFNASDPRHPRLGLCLQGTANLSSSVSPAFDIKNYDWSSNKYPAWTESVWSTFRIQVFIVPSHSYEVAVLCVGLAMTLVAMVICYCMSRYSGVLFQPEHDRID